MNIGAIIKLNRIKQNLRQDELAEGIISTSYLSKIENGKIEANDEVIKLLCLRLGIEINSQLDDETKERCEEWFQLLLTSSDTELLKEKHDQIQSLTIHDLELQVLVKIHMIRYYLKIGETSQAFEQINSLKDVSSTFNNKQKYYWLKFNGNYYSIIEEDNEPLQYYTLAEDLIHRLELPDEEIADLQYALGVTYSKLRLTSEAQSYANKALEYYRQIYHFSRCAECHLILGISYRRIRNHDKAIKNYHLAKQLAEQIDKKSLILLTHLNLGYLYYAKGDLKKSILHFDMIIKEEESPIEDKLLALTAIVEEYFLDNNYTEAQKRIYIGLEWFNNLPKENYLLYYYEIHVYKYLIENDKINFEELMVNKFIPYLEEQKDYARLTNYGTMLGEHFEKLHKYKSATKYLKLVNFSYKQFMQI